MKKALAALFFSAVTLLTGCVADPAAEGSATTHLSSDSIQYHEIRINAFSHFWATQKLWRTSLGGHKLLMTDTVSYADKTLYDTLVLIDTSVDKSADLPAHTSDNDYDGRVRLIYTTLQQPKVFSCYIYRDDRRTFYGAESHSGDTTDILRDGFSSYTLEDGYLDDGAYFYALKNGPNTIERLDCGYFPGKGFYIGYPDYDFYGQSFSSLSPGTEFVIRY